MPKIKTRQASAKRFRVTGSGRIKRKKANLRHILTTKGPKRKRQLRSGAYVQAEDEGKLRRQLPYG